MEAKRRQVLPVKHRTQQTQHWAGADKWQQLYSRITHTAHTLCANNSRYMQYTCMYVCMITLYTQAISSVPRFTGIFRSLNLNGSQPFTIHMQGEFWI